MTNKTKEELLNGYGSMQKKYILIGYDSRDEEIAALRKEILVKDMELGACAIDFDIISRRLEEIKLIGVPIQVIRYRVKQAMERFKDAKCLSKHTGEK